MPNELDPQFEDSLRVVFNNLPAPIRNFLGTPAVIRIVSALAQKYALRVDQSGILERELVLLLLGVKNPADFESTLEQEARIPRETIGRIVSDINEQIFLPLREEMRKEAATVAPPRPSIVPPPSYKPPPQPVMRAAPQSVPPAPPKPPSPAMSVREPEPTMPIKQGNPPSNLPGVLPERLLSDHEESAIRIPMETPLPARTPPPPPPAPKPFIPPPTPRQVTPPPQKPIATYTVDPYREPFTEN